MYVEAPDGCGQDEQAGSNGAKTGDGIAAQLEAMREEGRDAAAAGATAMAGLRALEKRVKKLRWFVKVYINQQSKAGVIWSRRPCVLHFTRV